MSEIENYTVNVIHCEGDAPGTLISKTCASLFSKNELVDCTISCSDGHLQAHRVVLASVSTYLFNLLTSTPLPTPCSHPILFLRNSTLADVQKAMDFIYTGKAQTCKNKLPALLEISQELGCISLRKAVESTIQSIGIETFKRRINNNNRSNASNGNPNENNNNNNDNTLKNQEKNNSKPKSFSAEDERMITLKQDIFSDDPDQDENNAEDLSNELKKNQNSNPNKRQSLIPTGSNEIKMARLITSMGTTISNGESSSPSLTSSNPDVILQHEKGESFVYTNEDFEIKSELEGGYDDENESGREEETPEPEPEQMEILRPIVNVNNIKDFLKAEIKQNDDNVGVPASCPWCLQVFTSLALLQKHIRSHVNNYRPFTCEYCHNTFARSAHLKRHLRTHTGEKPYQCNICQRPFARQDKLKSHLERHLNNASKPNQNQNMTITSYPPASMSQNTGGQVPIKVILPVGKVNGNNNNNIAIKNFSQNAPLFGNGIPNSNGLSISYSDANANLNGNSRPTSVSGGLIVTPANIPNSTTITPVLGAQIGNEIPTKRGKNNNAPTLSFLVK